MDAFLARQPILDRGLAVFGYELLFRNGADNYFQQVDGDRATASLISDAMNIHCLEKLTDGRHAFINFTRNALLCELYTVLPPATTIVEVLETLDFDAELLDACDRVRQNGYLLALDDYILQAQFDPLLNRIDILKVEFPELSMEQHKTVIESSRRYGFKLLAEKVETPEHYELARELGYDYFQGYFFCKPQMMKARRLPQSRVQCLRLMQLISRTDFDVAQVEELIRGDLALSYTLLRYLNSPLFRRTAQVQSVRHAITTLGQGPLRKWVSIITMQELSGEKPFELMKTCLIRARFCELVGLTVFGEAIAAECFTAGMFSLLDAMLDQPMDEITKELSLSDAVTKVLLKQESALSPVVQLAVAMEHGDWPEISRLTVSIDISESDAFRLHDESIQWAADVRSTSDGQQPASQS